MWPIHQAQEPAGAVSRLPGDCQEKIVLGLGFRLSVSGDGLKKEGCPVSAR